MAKRQRLHDDECEVDGISSLPDEVLVSILCLLSFKEATATSILSRRWRSLYTWTHKLDLDGTRLSGGNSAEGRPNYIEWVNGIISKHRSSTLGEFRLVFFLDRSHSPTIDEWLRFAISSRVEKLELNFRHISFPKYSSSYTIPYHGDEFKFLKKLSTNYVNVSGEFVKEVIRNCCLLEELSLTLCDILYVEIVNPSPCFKSLEISLCLYIKSLVIRDSNISTLKVMSMQKIPTVVLENVPLLSELWCWHKLVCTSVKDIWSMFSSVFPQLHLFKLYTLADLVEKDIKNFCSVANLSNLKQLEVVGGRSNAVLHVIDIINASPRLERFTLVMEPTETKKQNEEMHAECVRRWGKLRVSIQDKYHHLKEMKIMQYSGMDYEVEMVRHLVRNNLALQNIVIDTRRVNSHKSCNGVFDVVIQQKTNPEMLAVARHLNEYVPSRINLEIH